METQEPIPSRAALERAYKTALPVMDKVLKEMGDRTRACLEASGLFPAYKQRIKSFNSCFAKRVKFFREASAGGRPALPITDILAIRIICPFIGDLAKVEESLASRFKIVEVEHKGAERSFKEFG